MTAAVYFDQSELWGRQPEPYQVQVLADILDLLPSDIGSALDCGCGDGIITNALPADLKVVGLDPSPAALKHVHHETRVGTISAIPFPDKSFDLVLTTDVLEHLPPDVLAQAVRELTRVSRKYVLVCVPNQEQWRANFTRCAACGEAYHVNHHQRSWGEHDLAGGLMPPGWRPLEVRYSGLFRAPHDPTVELRHKLGLWNTWVGAVCPHCGTKDQLGPGGPAGRVRPHLDALCGNQWWAGGPSPVRFSDRSEVMALFGCGPRGPRLYHPTVPVVARDNPLALDFRNPLQRVGGWTVGPKWPCHLAGAEQVRCAQGVRLIRREFFANELALRFPAQPAPGDELVLDFTTDDREVLVNLLGWDPVRGERVPLDTRKVGPGAHQVRFTLGDGVRACYADRYGFLFIVSILGNVVARRADLRPGIGPAPAVPWLYLAAGHQVYSQRTPDYIRSWGFTSLEGGRLPLPVELAEAGRADEQPADDLAASLRAVQTRQGRKRADSLFFLMQQALAEPEPAAGAAEPPKVAPEPPSALRGVIDRYHRVINHRGKRVLVISHLYPTKEQPGLGPFVHEQVSALRANSGIDARVVCCKPFWFNTFNPVKISRAYRVYRRQFHNLRWESIDGVPVLFLPYMVGGFFRHWLHGATYCNSVMLASDWIHDTFDFELIHAHTGYLDGTAALALGRKYAVPYLVTEHTGPFRLLTENPLVRHKTLRALTAAERVFCVSGALAGDVLNLLPPAERGKVEVLHNGVDTALFYPPLRWDRDPARPRVLSVISLDENKNPDLLLDAFKLLREGVPGARLAVVGQGPLEPAIRKRVRAEGLDGAVELLGFRPRADVARLMRDECDVLVLPSNSETFGVVLIEALACGKPVVSTDCGGPRDVVSDPALGLLCPPGDARALADALARVAADLGRYRPDEIRRRVLEQFDYDNLAARLAEAYDHLLPSAPQ